MPATSRGCTISCLTRNSNHRGWSMKFLLCREFGNYQFPCNFPDKTYSSSMMLCRDLVLYPLTLCPQVLHTQPGAYCDAAAQWIEASTCPLQPVYFFARAGMLCV